MKYSEVTCEHLSSCIQKLSSGSNDGRGRHAKYFNLNNGWGIKFYYSQSIRDNAHSMQSVCEKLGLAPKTGESFEITIEGFTYYAYITEHVQTVQSAQIEYESVFPAPFSMMIAEDYPIGLKMNCDSIYQKYLSHNIIATDILNFNCGIIHGNEIVMIDFGDMEMRLVWDEDE